MQIESSKHTIDSAINTIGYGWMQIFVLIVVGLQLIGSDLYYYNVSYWELYPVLKCQSSPPFYKCTKEDICVSNPPLWEVDFEDTYTLKNWVIESNLFCTSDFKIGLIGSFFYIGMTLGCLAVNFNDHIGWKKSMIIASSVTLIANYFLFFFHSLTMKYFSMFLLGLSLEFNWIVSYMLTLEIAPSKYHGFNNGAINIMDMSFNMILPTLFVKYISWNLNYYFC